MATGRRLAAIEDKKLEHAVKLNMEYAKTFLSKLTPEELHARRSNALNLGANGQAITSVILGGTGAPMSVLDVVRCPVCENDGVARYDATRATGQRVASDGIVQDVLLLASMFICGVCGLHLEGLPECAASGIKVEEIRSFPRSTIEFYNLQEP